MADNAADRDATCPATPIALHHRIRHYEVDAQGFLFNSRYLELADAAMTEYFRRLGFPYLDLLATGLDPSVVSAQIQFRAPARFEDMVSVTVCCVRVGTSSFVLGVEVSRGEDRLAEIVLTYVNVEAASATARRLPEQIAQALRQDAADGAPWKSTSEMCGPC